MFVGRGAARSARFIIECGVVAAVAIVGCVQSSGMAAAHPARPAAVQFALSPTFPTHTGDLPTTAVGQDTGVLAQFSYSDVGWIPGKPYAVDVDLVEVHHVTDPARCSAKAAATVYTEPVSERDAKTDERLSLGFVWPAAASARAGGGPYYAVCLHQRVPKGVAASPDVLSGGVADIGGNRVYKVLGDVAPTAGISARVVRAGRRLIVRGRHWNYYQRAYADVEGNGTGIAILTYNGPIACDWLDQAARIDARGNFTATFTLPRYLKGGTYYVALGNQWFRTYAVGTRVLRFRLLNRHPLPRPNPGSPPPCYSMV